MKKTLALAALGLLIVGAIGVGYYYWYGRDNGVLHFPGVVEIQEVRLGSKVGGRVAKVLIQEGLNVSPGQELVTFEAPELESQLAQLQAAVAVAQAELDKALNGARPEEKEAARYAAEATKAKLDRLIEGWRKEEKKQAESELESAEAELKQAGERLERVAKLITQRSASREDYEAALALRDSLKGKMDAARAKNAMLQSGSRKEDIAEARAEWQKARANFDVLNNGTRPEDKELAKAKLAEARAKLKEVEANLREATVIVPKELGRAVVEVVSVRPGDLVPPNQPIIRVLRIEDLWVKIFVPETQLGLVTLNRAVEIQLDSFPNKRFKGVVMQRASISEFTPRNVQSLDERHFQMFAVKIRVEDTEGVFNAGMAAQVYVPVE
jgi:membrane fusion protein YbhG